MKDDSGLRRQAERVYRQRINEQDKFNADVSLEHIEELQVHKIELELQNIALQKAHAHLEEAHQKYTDLFFNAPIGYMRCDENGLIMQANRALSSMLGMNGESMQGLAFASFSSTQDQDVFYLHCREVIRSGEKCSCEVALISRSGTKLCSMIESVVVAASASAPKHLRIAVIDISKQKETETKLSIATQKAEVANQAKSDFLAVMSHELRTPLHGIIGLQNILKNEARYLQPEHLKCLEMAQYSSSILLSLIEDVLDLSKIEAGKVIVNPKVFNLSELLTSSLSIFISLAEDKQINLELIFQHLPTSIQADKALIRQILLNLVGNAVKFTDKGYVRIVASYEDQLLTMTIEDTGIGIKASEQAILFEPFVQLSNDAERKGTGLGTTIAMRLAEAMTGKINVSSVVGQGSIFTLTLPVTAIGSELSSGKVDLSKVMTKQSIASNIDLSPAQQNLRVLLAEDDDISRMIALRRLKHTKFHVDTAVNGLEAWEKVQKNCYDLLLTDIRMPGMDGIELTSRIRDHEKAGKHRTHIIGLSAYALEDTIQHCLDIGMDDFICKPVDADELLSRLPIL